MTNIKKDTELLTKHFDAISILDIKAIVATFHPEIIIEAPFTPEIFSETVPSRMLRHFP